MNRHRNRAFAVETLLLTLFFLLALALLVQLFGAAQAMGRQARQETDAALLLQNASARGSPDARLRNIISNRMRRSPKLRLVGNT